MFSPVKKEFRDVAYGEYRIGEDTRTPRCETRADDYAESTHRISDRDRDTDIPIAALDTNNQGNFEGDYWQAVDSGVFGDLPDFNTLDGEEDQVDRAGALCSWEEPAFFLSQHSSHLAETKEVTALLEDLSPEQVVVFRFLATQVRSVFLVRTSMLKKARLLEWIFSAGTLLENAAFEDCCTALDCRPWVMRLRIHLEFWRKDVQLSEKIKGLIVPVPERILEETYALADASGSWLLHRVWEFPGISSERLCRNSEDQASLERLEEAGILLASYQRFWYCVGRSPLTRAGLPRSQSWASFWRNF